MNGFIDKIGAYITCVGGSAATPTPDAGKSSPATDTAPVAPQPSGDALDKLPSVLRAVAPAMKESDVDAWSAAMVPVMRSGGIVTARRIAAFVGQVAEESGLFAVLEENLHYHAPRIMAVWPSRFATEESAEPYAMNPERLANNVYSSRMGNGDEASGDGWKFRGRGLIQLTGRGAYTKLAASVGRSLDDCTDWLLTKPGAATSACWFWSVQKINPLADAWDITGVTKRTNGGTINLDRRVALSEAAAAVLR